MILKVIHQHQFVQSIHQYNILKIDFDATNLSKQEINYYSSYVYAVGLDGTLYSPQNVDLAAYGYDNTKCSNYSIDINPKLTKSYSYCFEVPNNENSFDLSIRSGNFDSCDSSFSSHSLNDIMIIFTYLIEFLN